MPEYQIDFRSDYTIYIGREGDSLVILLPGDQESSADIATVHIVSEVSSP